MTELEEALEGALQLKKAYDNPSITLDNEQVYFEEQDDAIHVAVAGSNDYIDWAQNLTAWRWWRPGWWPKDWWDFHKTIPGTQHWKATSGYVNAAKTFVRMIEPHLSDKDKPIKLKGHSKGAPVAGIGGEMLDRQGYKVAQLLTYGSPRFSVQKIDTFVFRTCRQYIAVGDHVPDFPETTTARNWQHQGRVIRIGSEEDDLFGVVRDHLINRYITILQKEVENES